MPEAPAFNYLEDWIVIGFGDDAKSQSAICCLDGGVSYTNETGYEEYAVGCFHWGERLDTKDR